MADLQAAVLPVLDLWELHRGMVEDRFGSDLAARRVTLDVAD